VKRRALPLVAALVTVIILFASSIVWFYYQLPPHSLPSEPADFYAISKEVSLSELIDIVERQNRTVYLPSELPEGFELTAIYVREDEFLAIIVYSVEDNKDYKTAELTIEISPSLQTPTLDELKSWAEDSEHEKALEINGWPVWVNEKAYIGVEERREKYGKEYAPLVIVWIKGHRYMIGSPVLTVEELIQLVRSMKSLSNFSLIF